MPELDRRDFLAAGGATFLCTLGGETSGRSPKDVAKIDAAAAALPRPGGAARRDPVDALQFKTPEPQPGGQRREYWIGARTVAWDIAPTGRDEWMNQPRAARAAPALRAFVYQACSAGFANPIRPARMPGPTLHAEVGDVIVVHFRNLDRKLHQAVTMHSHGVRYNPEYDGAYLGDFTRAGGFVAPGEEFTYVWEATPDSVGVWPYHDHGPNHTLNTLRGLFGAVIVREKGAPRARRRARALPSQLPAPGHRLRTRSSTASTAAATPATRRRSARASGQRVALHVIGMDPNFHTFHIHGHRWRDSRAAPSWTARRSDRTRRSRRASWRTIRGGGSTTATLPPPGRRHGRLVPGGGLIP